VYGTCRHEERLIGTGNRARNRLVWAVKTEPHVMLRLKRVFEGMDKGQFGEVLILDSPQACRDLLWFTQRYPLEVTPLERLQAGAEAHAEREAIVEQITAGDYKPPDFDLAFPPRDYQRVAAALALRSRGLLLADEMGVGKTVSAIAMLTDRATRPAAVVTLTSLPRQWERELRRFMPGVQVHLAAKGTPPENIRARFKGRLPDVVVLNYSKLSGWAEYLATWCRSVIFDEVQELRQGKDTDEDSEKYRGAKHLAQAMDYRLGLSGTPFMNYGEEMWPVIDVLSPGSLGTRPEFLREWCSAFGRHHLVREPRVFGQFLREQGLMLRRTRKDVGRELPACQVIEHTIDTDQEPLRQVEGAAAELARFILEGHEKAKGEKRNAAAELDWRLRQATGIAKAPHVADFTRLLVESGEQVVLFGWHKTVYEVWRERLADLNPQFIIGGMSLPQRERSLELFKRGECKVLVMSLRVGAGLDGLQHVCRTTVFGELDWSSGWHEQDIARVFRDGQAHPVTAYFLVSEWGSDPVIAEVTGLKKLQLEQVRDPKAPLVERLELDPDHMKRLAEHYLRRAS
jgi:SNF2 family DNA or RNA helicase